MLEWGSVSQKHRIFLFKKHVGRSLKQDRSEKVMASKNYYSPSAAIKKWKCLKFQKILKFLITNIDLSQKISHHICNASEIFCPLCTLPEIIPSSELATRSNK